MILPITSQLDKEYTLSYVGSLSDPTEILLIIFVILGVIGIFLEIYYTYKLEEVMSASLEVTVSDLIYLMEKKKVNEEYKKKVMILIEKAYNDTFFLLACKKLRYLLRYRSKWLFKMQVDYIYRYFF